MPEILETSHIPYYNKDASWHVFNDALMSCTIDFDENYFQIRRNSALPVWRERAYCYELYHRLRMELAETDFIERYTIHGEIDKRGHDVFLDAFNSRYMIVKKELFGEREYEIIMPNPDFIIHTPGSHDNLIVIEVKSSDGLTYSKALEDIAKLKAFTEMGGGYRYGIFLIYGYEDPDNNHISRLIRRLEGTLTDNLFIYWHATPNERPKVFCRP